MVSATIICISTVYYYSESCPPPKRHSNNVIEMSTMRGEEGEFPCDNIAGFFNDPSGDCIREGVWTRSNSSCIGKMEIKKKYYGVLF